MRKLTILLTALLSALAMPIYAQTGVAVSIRNGTVNPATCNPQGANVFFNRTTGLLQLCVSSGKFSASGSAQTLTPGTLTATNTAIPYDVVSRYDWTNAMVVAIGGVTTGDLTICTLPARTVVENVYVVIDTPDTSANALTVAAGRTAAAYIDYIVASDAKAAANTVYGDASGERGTNLNMYDLPSYTGTTAVNLHFIKTTTFLSSVTGSTGHVYIVTSVLP